MQSSLCTHLDSLQLNDTSEKGAYTLVWNLNFCNCHLGNASKSPNMETSRAYDCVPMRLYVFVYFKSCCLKFWLPISLKLGAK